MQKFAIGVLAMVAFAAVGRTPALAVQCDLKELAEADLSFDAAGGPRIPVTINSEAKTMLIDTGGVVSTVTEQTVDELQLRTFFLPPASFVLADGKYMDRAAKLSELTIGHMHAKDWTFVVIPRSENGSGNWAGTISPDILANYDVEFDFGAGKFSLLSQDHCPGEVVYWTKQDHAEIPFELTRNYHIRLTAQLDGQPVVADIDTGSSTSAMNFTTARDMFSISRDDPALKRFGDPETSGYARYPFKTLSIGGITVQNPKIDLGRFKGLSGEVEKLIIGMDVLRHLHLYIAYKEKTLYVTGADAH